LGLTVHLVVRDVISCTVIPLRNGIAISRHPF
jgi:hypothetical protein